MAFFQVSGSQKDYKIVAVPRARRVHQAIWTVLPTFVHSVLACIYLVTIAPLFKKDPFGAPFADLLIMNGPGTCVTLCAAVMVNKVSSALYPTSSEYPYPRHRDTFCPAARLATSKNDIRRIVCTRAISLSLWEDFAPLGRPVRLSDITHRNPINHSAVFLFSGLPCCQVVVVRSVTGAWFDAIELIPYVAC